MAPAPAAHPFGCQQAKHCTRRLCCTARHDKDPALSLLRLLPLFLSTLILAACTGNTRSTPPADHSTATARAARPAPPPKIRIGLALGGGAAKGFAHIGVIKMLEANGISVDVVSGTSAGSVVGAMYASGMDAFAMQEKAVALDEAEIRDMRLFSGGLIQGRKLQDYVNAQVAQRPLERLGKPFAAVATQLETGKRTAFVSGNTGQAVRASSSVPGVFEPVAIGQWHYVDGGVVSPVPVDAARDLGAEFVIAVDISSKASGKLPDGMFGIVNQSIAIMGQRAGAEELQRADVAIRPAVQAIGPTDFSQRSNAIIAGEKAALAALPQIRSKLAAIASSQAKAATDRRAAQARKAKYEAQLQAAQAECDRQRSSMLGKLGHAPACDAIPVTTSAGM